MAGIGVSWIGSGVNRCEYINMCGESSLGGLKCEFLTTVNASAAREYLSARSSCEHIPCSIGKLEESQDG
jgi:hypothetical protein